MAMETVQAVRQAELNAACREGEATQERDAILQRAEQDREELIQSMTKTARDQAEQDLQSAQNHNNELMKTMIVHAEKEIMVLRELVKEKEKSAVAIVLAEVI